MARHYRVVVDQEANRRRGLTQSSLQRQSDGLVVEHKLDPLDDLAGSLTGVYARDELGDLRDEWD